MPHVLIVDDEPYQRLLIRETLADDHSLTFSEADDGLQALDRAQRLPHPDLVILDVMMPQVDGLGVCRALKADPVLRVVPVILVTALGHVQDKVAGLDAGADDFINKPFDESELQARVRSALRMKALHDELQHVLQLRDNLVRMIMHDMGNLVTVISSALSLYDRMPSDSPEASQLVQDAYEANLSLADMISDALDVSSSETHQMPVHRKITDITALTQALLESFRSVAMERNVKLDLCIHDGFEPVANVDPDLMRRVLANLLTNALKYTPADSHVRVDLRSDDAHETFRIAVSDEGPGISPEEQAIIFNKYEMAQLYQDHRERPGRGLGLTFSKMAVEAHGGTISVQSTPGQGATFAIDIPRE